MHKHLAIMSKGVIEAILSGQKTVETRFSKNRIVPFGVISVGDLIYVKPPGGEVVGQLKVKKVIFVEGLTAEDIEKIFSYFQKEISSGNKEEDGKYFQEKKAALYGTLIFIGESERFLTSPLRIKKKDRRGWVVLD